MTAQNIRRHATTHLPQGSDPLEFPPGLLAGGMSVDLAVTFPGTLTLRYKCGETSGPLLDSSEWDGTARDLAYLENTTAYDWSPANAPTRHVLDHTSFGDGDDGTVKFNYDQPEVNPFLHPLYGGAYFQGSTLAPGPVNLARWGLVDPFMQSVGAFFKPQAAIFPHSGQIFGCRGYDGTSFNKGWGILYDHSTNVVSFYGNQGAGGSSLTIDAPGACTLDTWYHACVTWDGTTYRLYLNAVLVGSAVSSDEMNPSADATGNVAVCSMTSSYGLSSTQSFFIGSVDEIDTYSSCLTLAEIQNLFLAKGAGTMTTIDTVTIGEGSSSDPVAVHSGSHTANEALFADGSGGTEFRRPTIIIYRNGL